MAAVRSASADSAITAASGEVGEEGHWFSDEATALLAQQEDIRQIGGNTDLVGRTPLLAPTTAVSQTSGSGRLVHTPCRERDDVGRLSVCQGNWGGHRNNPRLSEHIVRDVAQQNPCHIVVAQEVDEVTRNRMTAEINP